MAFGIAENTTSYFINNKIELPRFQRKATWKDNDNFKLCISVFKGYPIGVIIVNEIGRLETKYLLDGRQRRNALTTMYSDPIAVYNWGKKFLGIKPTTPEGEVKDKFTEKISEYLQSEFDKSTEDSNEIDDALENDSIGERSFDASIQGENLHVLLDLILMVHGKYKGSNTFEGIFKFDKIIDPSELDYTVPVDGDYVVDAKKLKKFLKSVISDEETSKEDFSLRLKKRYRITDPKKIAKFDQYLTDHWDYISDCFETIRRADEIIINAKIGLIRLIDASPLDAQNIFSLVNGGGAKLTAEELLSARPYWNEPVENPSDEVRSEANLLYQFLGIKVPENVVRWDVCATILSRIDKRNLIFSKFDLSDDKTKDTLFTKKLTLGFKVLSAVYVGGISSNSVKELENEKKVNINWNVDIDAFVRDFNVAVDLLYDCEYFKYMLTWNQSIMSLMGNSVALEFASLIYKNWKELESPRRGQVKVKNFQKNAIVLCDKLLYEYSSRIWAGSGDSRLARDLQSNDRFNVVSTEDWNTVIDNFASGNDASVCKGIIYHYYCLKKMMPQSMGLGTDAKYEIDHIYAQAQFDSTTTIDTALMESIGNKALLPKGENIAKSDRALNELRHEAVLYDLVKIYTGIKEDDIDKYSDITNIQELINERIADYKKVFKDDRITLLNSASV